jgi:hypothetical protein
VKEVCVYVYVWTVHCTCMWMLSQPIQRGGGCAVAMDYEFGGGGPLMGQTAPYVSVSESGFGQIFGFILDC